MAGINSILFLLSTLSPFSEPPDDVTAPYDWTPDFHHAWDYSAKSCGSERVFVYCHYELQTNCTNYEERTGYKKGPAYDVEPSDIHKCIPGCVCVEPKIKGPDERCIFPEECPNAKSDWKIRPDSDSDESSLSPDYVLTTEDSGGNTVKYAEEPNLPPEEHSAIQRQIFRCPKNEEWTVCPSFCPDNCYNYEYQNMPCKAYCFPIPRCECKSGFVRRPAGDCVKPDQCPGHQIGETCPENEQYTSCGSACPPTCDNSDKTACPAVCVPGCFCKEPMVRGPDGKCVLIDECPGRDGKHNNKIVDSSLLPNICKDNEEFSVFTSMCPDNCDNYQNPHRTCNYFKRPGCRCKEGYVRGREGICIRIEQCEEHKNTCPENEQYTACGSACPKTCDNYNGNIICPAVCVPGCFCQESMVRGPDGKCILTDECPGTDGEDISKIVDSRLFPNICKDNEEFSMFSSLCPDNCDNYQNPHRACNYFKGPGCRCKEGYVRGREGVCIRIEQCEEHNTTCPENEHYTTCGSACPKNCDNYNENIICPAVCVAGCFCQEPMVRGPDGKCILTDECPGTEEKRCPENEEYITCRPTCPKTCDNYDKSIICPGICIPGCYCKEPMVRGPDGKCILIVECPEEDKEACPENEKYTTCGSACPQTCDNYNETIACPDICVPGCFCEEPMVRGPNGKCILIDGCPSLDQETCPENEQYTTYGSACPKTCDNYDNVVPCPDIFVAGCFCQEPMVRGPDGKCISTDKCPGSDKGNDGMVDASKLPFLCKDDEEYFPFNSLCPDNCDNYQNRHRSCNYIRFPGCRCKEGYVKERGGDCVRSDQCKERQPEDCTENEYFDVCGSHCEADCVDYRRRRQLTKCKDQRCKKGCFCKNGYVRGPNWECVAQYDCPTIAIPKLF